MFELIPENLLAAGLGLIGGIVLGLASRLARFCTLGAIEDALYAQNYTLVRMWGVAIGSAIIFVSLGMFNGWIVLETSAIRAVPFTPMLTILGGIIFGAGMAFSGNCGFGALSRLGGGDLRSFVIVLVMGITTYTVSSGVFSSINAWLRDIFTISQKTPG
ncbi:MAG: YeeE/YedE thiosulfate transporter family protein, partial [Paracoccaceae bacterium]